MLTPERRAMLRDDSVEAVAAGLNWIALPPADLLALLDATEERADAAQINIQWKGFEACLDVNCQCGNFFHVDEWTFGRVTCPACNTSYPLPHGVVATPEGDPT